MVVLRIKFPLTSLKGNSHQILLSEMSLPGVEVLIEKLLPKIYGRLGKENHCNARFTLADPTPRLCPDAVGSANVNGFPTRNRLGDREPDVYNATESCNI